MTVIRFRFATHKALAAIHWMVTAAPGIDLHSILKACYWADKSHLNRYGRPVFGATYRAMKFGPVPVEIYQMAKGEAYWLAELGTDRYPWRLSGFRLYPMDNDMPNLGTLSETDMEVLREGLAWSRSMTFDERTAATHGPDWQAANLGYMRYEDMVEESPEKAERVAYLRATAPHMRL